MKILLDTNVYFALIHEAGYLEQYQRLLMRIAPTTYLSSVVRFELLQGARGDVGRAKVNRATRQLERAGRVVVPTHDEWVHAGHVQGKLWDRFPALRSKKLQNDILIACTTRRLGALLVTENLADFSLIGRLLPHHIASIDQLARTLTRGGGRP